MEWTKIAAVAAALLGSASFVSGVSCAIQAIADGSIGHRWHECLTLIVAGTGVASPGVNALKVGAFIRPATQQTKDPLVQDKR